MDTVSLVIIGVYTVVNIIVFTIQQSQIKSQKGIIESMKTFTDMFKVDDVRKYMDMREETMRGVIENLVNNDDRIKSIFKEFTEEELQKNRTGY